LSCRFDEKRDGSGRAHVLNPFKADGRSARLPAAHQSVQRRTTQAAGVAESRSRGRSQASKTLAKIVRRGRELVNLARCRLVLSSM
jgi:hypothetical protein